MYTHENGRKIPLRDVQDLNKVHQKRINVYDETGERILKNVDISTVKQKMIGENMGFFGKIKKAVGKKIDDSAKEKTLKQKIDYNEKKRSAKAKAETYKRKGLTEDEAMFMAEREVKREADTKKRIERDEKLKRSTAALRELGNEINKPVQNSTSKKEIHKKTKHTVHRVEQNTKRELPNPNKLNFKL